MNESAIEKVSLQLTFDTGLAIDTSYIRTYGYISPTATDEQLNAFINQIGAMTTKNILIRRKVVVYTLEEG